ncbi:DUF3883 domain-containing protein [Nonomuraea angiospora]|uniref:DUF3883 domain-containing protein n=1 Tax=Nonomuraea angiospora TaxID=46172 RepID=UPI00332B6A41
MADLITAGALSTSPSGIPRSRGMNYYGSLTRILRDLTGFATLTFELLQNADDARATRLRFDFSPDQLTVFNDAVFSDCGDQDLPSAACLYLADRGHRCDFHSFRDVASGDKRERAETTGAFGIGFTAVYQIADRAVLISSGRRWEIDEMQPEGQRIMELPAPEVEGTTLILPWARDPGSLFRQTTASAAVQQDDPRRLFDALLNILPTAMLFLRHVREVELIWDGQERRYYRREDADEICEISYGDETCTWLMLHGDFTEEAKELRSRFPSKIEDRRRTDVTVAIPVDANIHGLLCAYLPTEEGSGIPAHVNADFIPESDRRHLITDSFHGAWNRLAVRAAADVLARNLPDLTEKLGAEPLWRLIYAAYQAKGIGSATGIAAYWEEIGPQIPRLRVMQTTTGDWTTPDSTVYLSSSEEEEVVPVLEQLGVAVMHPDVGTYARRITGIAGAHQLSVEILAKALRGKGLLRPVLPAEAPPEMAEARTRELLWRELDRLLNRSSPAEHALLPDIALMPGNDGRLWPSNQLKRASEATALLITDLGLDLPLLDESLLPNDLGQLASLCPPLEPAFILSALADQNGAERLQQALQSGRVTAARMLQWLRGHEELVLANAGLAAQVRSLPIYPTGEGNRPLSHVVLPGGFTDRLGIANAIDSDQLSEHVAFLQRLGAKQLTLKTYLTEWLPRAAAERDNFPAAHWRQLIVDLATHLDEFAQDSQVRQALTPLPLVMCGRDAFFLAASCYFANEAVTSVLGKQAPIAIPIEGHERATTSLYEWLEVADKPRPQDIVAEVRRITADAPDESARKSVSTIIQYLGRTMRDTSASPPEVLGLLRHLTWLPARNDSEWRRPSDVYNRFREQLFATQGKFLDVSYPVQQGAADFLEWLGVQSNPSITQVVNHLLAMVDRGEQVSSAVYDELNNNADDPALRRLIGQRCLLLSEGQYVTPNTVFRRKNPFGRFRRLLGPLFDTHSHLLDRLSVKHEPDHEDARSVLLDIAREQQVRFHLPVEGDDLTVIQQCWKMLDEALTCGDVDPGWFAPLRDQLVIPNAAVVPTPPSRLLIDDMPGVAAVLNVGDSIIQRKEGLWRAFEAAGVRSLTEAVDIEIVEMRETCQSGEVHDRLRSRRTALARILDGEPDGVGRLTDTLARLACPQATALSVRYHLDSFKVTSPETALRALYVPAGNDSDPMLISCQNSDGTWPWMLIAKEVARALYPGVAPGPLASSLYIALQAQSLDAAHSALDDAGWPRLDKAEILPLAESDDAPYQPQRPQGHEETELGEADGNASSDTAASRANRTSSVELPEQQPRDSNEIFGSTPQAGTSNTGWHESGRPRQSQSDGALSATPQGPWPTHGRRDPHRGRLRSYVVQDSGERREQAPAVPSLVDQEGIRRVVELERAEGRQPEVMPHNNPGFDVLSRDNSGHILRHIEVKSTADAWDDIGVGLSRTQFEFGQQHSETSWLYVVEYALDDAHARIVRVADPAGRTEEFRFDSGWAAVDEAASTRRS